MRQWAVFALLGLLSLAHFAHSASHHGDVDRDENEFAEFEDAEEEEEVHQPPKPHVTPPPAPPQSSQRDKPAAVDDDGFAKADEDLDDEFKHLEDEEEFENYDKVKEAKGGDQPAAGAPEGVQQLKFADVPSHFRSHWASYQVEAVVLVVLALYMLNYAAGRATNQTIASRWFDAHRETLEKHFALVGDDGISDPPLTGHVHRETDCTFSIWCTGRVGMSGMLAQIRTVKRQDLMSRLFGLFSPQTDKVTFKFELDPNEMDAFVVAFGQRKTVNRQFKELADLSMFTSEKKGGDRFTLPASFTLFAEMSEVAYALFDGPVLTVLRKHEKFIDYIHISDQFSGPKPPEGETLTRLPDVSRVLIFSYNLNDSNEQVEEDLIALTFYLVDKIRRFRLSKEGKAKADKKRQSVHDAFLKTTHLQRQEAAQARREEKTRERKQRILEEEDPEKQRRLEKLELKREQKMKQPKMKQLKMK